MSSFSRHRRKLFISGEWVGPATDRVSEIRSPSTEEIVGSVPVAEAVDVDAAVRGARAAFDDPTGWASWSATERSAALRRLADELAARGADAAGLMVDEMGMPVRLADGARTTRAVDLLRYYADLAVTMDDDAPGGRPGATVVRRQPVGVVAAIVPYNGPLTLTMFKAAPALAVGCTIVVKPSPVAPLALFLLAEAVQAAGLPPGVLSVVTGEGPAGDHLVNHPGVDKVAFTGSTAVGQTIARSAADRLASVTLELGGKSAAVLLEDADLVGFTARLPGLSFSNAGQNCFCHSRILAPRHRYAEVVDAVAATAEAVVVGDPHRPETEMGPLISAAHRDRVEAHIATARDAGARLVTGGGRPAGLSRGFYVEPTVFADVDPSMRIAREEVFGPVVAVIAYDGEQEAIAIANDGDFGLAGSVWSRDRDHAEQVARRLDIGTVGINGYDLDFSAPFGGRRLSGLGYELGPQGLESYVKLQSLYRDSA